MENRKRMSLPLKGIDVKNLDTSREADRLQIEIFRRMGPEKRLQAGIALSQTCRKLLEAGVRLRHPEYGEEEIKLAVFRLTLPEDLFLSAYPYAQNIRP